MVHLRQDAFVHVLFPPREVLVEHSELDSVLLMAFVCEEVTLGDDLRDIVDVFLLAEGAQGGAS